MKTAVIILLLFTCASSVAQVNLVMNPSLENYSRCPAYIDEIRFADYWMSLDSSFYPDPPTFSIGSPGVPEYCDVCAEDSSSEVGVPSSVYYHHYPRTGNGMAQVQMFYNQYNFGSIPATQYRDYLQGHLSATLTAGKSYCVTFYVVQEDCSNYNVNHIGAYLDDGIIDTLRAVNTGLIQSQYTPQIIENTIISDTVNWTKIQGSFIANGTERLITIGNFADTAHMSFAPISDTSALNCVCLTGPGYSLYLVDDVSVIASNAIANAGPDRVIDSAGDTVLIGDTLDSYVPTYWYANGVVIDSNKSGIYVHPDTTTTYVLALLLCDTVSYDTVVVRLASDTIIHKDTTGTDTTSAVKPLTPKGEPAIWPNPVHNGLTVNNGVGSVLYVYDMVGSEVFSTVIRSNREVENIESLAAGVYVVEVVNTMTGYRVVRRVVKE